MRIHIIACRVLTRELEFLASQSTNIVDITWLPQGLHNTPDKLRKRIAQSIQQIWEDVDSETEHNAPDAICLGFGLCSNGVVGLEALRVPLVVPRTDDCIALFLGSQARYLKLFKEMQGTYWLNNGWIEECGSLVSQRQTREQRWQTYAEKYGEDNADYLLEQEGLWMERYEICGFIESDVFFNPAYPGLAQKAAQENGWEYKRVPGDLSLLKRMLEGDWDDSEFLVCPPGQRVEAEYTGRKVQAVPAEGTNP